MPEWKDACLSPRLIVERITSLSLYLRSAVATQPARLQPATLRPSPRMVVNERHQMMPPFRERVLMKYLPTAPQRLTRLCTTDVLINGGSNPSPGPERRPLRRDP
ncbi:hypothetical protein EVAR_101044_1 [Eumeta japonica]|uniref:Uncharacterized protein n=1 Tax=Eumeta variegata TaxID=151549 RepID=A0A4C1SMS5_EUMVA|nr:hypothetical protein EVAR_101044_1 [Eumeta japonica]